MQRQGLKRRPCLCTPSPLHPNNVANTAHVAPGTCSKPPSLRCAPVSSLDDSDHFFDNQLTSVAALRSLIGFRRNADRLPSGTLIDFPRIRNSEESLQEKLEYLRQNPVRRGLVARPEDYRWLWVEKS
jgi:hypothetical protein